MGNNIDAGTGNAHLHTRCEAVCSADSTCRSGIPVRLGLELLLRCTYERRARRRHTVRAPRLTQELFARPRCQYWRGDANGVRQNGGGGQCHTDDRHSAGPADHVHGAAAADHGLAVGGPTAPVGRSAREGQSAGRGVDDRSRSFASNRFTAGGIRGAWIETQAGVRVEAGRRAFRRRRAGVGVRRRSASDRHRARRWRRLDRHHHATWGKALNVIVGD